MIVEGRSFGSGAVYHEGCDPVKEFGASVWITSELSRALLAMPIDSTTSASLDLGRSTTTVRRTPEGCSSGVVDLSQALLAAVAERDLIVRVDASGEVVPLRVVHGCRLYRLVPTPTAPTVTIAGVQMHRRDDPWADAAAKATSVVRPGDWVLDTCGGLGYTAAWALAVGAGLVVSAEPDPAILWLRRRNPWSPREATVGLLLLFASAQEVVASAPEAAFDAVLHDPPRFSLAGELYGRSFYAALRRVLRRGGRLYHYTGTPYRRLRGRSFVRAVARRLSEAGFSVSWNEETAGFVGRAL